MTEVDVVGGLGHVGLPLSLKLSMEGCDVNIVDTDEEAIELFKNGEARFEEDGVEEAIESEKDDIDFTEKTRGNSVVFLCTDKENHEDVLKSALPSDFTGILCVRQTVPPGTSRELKNSLKEHWPSSHYAFTPERLAQGKGLEEIDELPQVVGVEFTSTFMALSQDVFTWTDCYQVSPTEAELTKLYCNFYRYGTFALSNEMYLICEEFGADPGKVYEAATKDYPRMEDIPTAGFAGAFCIKKDTSFLSPYSNLAEETVETNAEDFIDGMVRKIEETLVEDKTVGVFGISAKPDNDETRYSLMSALAMKMGHLADPARVSDSLMEVLLSIDGLKMHDPYLRPDTFEEVKECDVWMLGMPHEEYSDLELPQEKESIDPWTFWSGLDE